MSEHVSEAASPRSKDRTLLVLWLSGWSGVFVVTAVVLVITRIDGFGVAALVALGLMGGAIFGSVRSPRAASRGDEV